MPRKKSQKPSVEVQEQPNEVTCAIAVIEQPRYDPTTGAKQSVPTKVTYAAQADWDQFLTFGPQLSYVIRELVALPEGWTKPKKELIKPE